MQIFSKRFVALSQRAFGGGKGVAKPGVSLDRVTQGTGDGFEGSFSDVMAVDPVDHIDVQRDPGMGGKRLKALLAENIIEIAPVAYMRGRTLNNAFIVIDEAQNCTYGQLKMMLTRLGWNSTMVITGDPDQTDLLPGLSGLCHIADKLSVLQDIAVVRLGERDIVRHPLVAAMLTVL